MATVVSLYPLRKNDAPRLPVPPPLGLPLAGTDGAAPEPPPDPRGLTLDGGAAAPLDAPGAPLLELVLTKQSVDCQRALAIVGSHPGSLVCV
jgi:hypothetical protein